MTPGPDGPRWPDTPLSRRLARSLRDSAGSAQADVLHANRRRTPAAEYQKAPYGPYAENLRHVLQTVEGHLVSGYADGGDAPDKQIELVPGAVHARAPSSNNTRRPEPASTVAELVEGFESPFGLELLATVHWISTREHPVSEDVLIQRTYAWAERKRQFSEHQIRLARRVLNDLGWVTDLSA